MGAADGFTDSGELDGLTVYDNDGEKVGSVGRVYVDDDTGKPDWITVKTGLFGMKESFVPLAGARRVGSDLHVAHPKESVKDAPRVDADAHLSVAEEEELYRHYGLTRKTGNLAGNRSQGMDAPTAAGTGAMGAAGAAGTARGTGKATTAGTGKHRDTDASTTSRPLAGAGAGTSRAGEQRGKEEMIRSEEELHVGKEEYESGRARLHKYVVTEEVTRTVPV
ncbi:PRC-barrel domain-containing protein, partial [Streptomyces sp. NPDC059346]